MTHLISNTIFEELKYWLAVQELCQAITKATYILPSLGGTDFNGGGF